MYKISKKLALFCAVLLIYPLVFTAKPSLAAQNNEGRVTEYEKNIDEKLKADKSEYEKDVDEKLNTSKSEYEEEADKKLNTSKSEYEEEADKKLNAAKSEYTKDTDRKLNSDKADEKNENQPKELRLIIELDKDSLVEEAINKDIDYDKLDEVFIDEKKQELKEDQDKLLTEIKNEAIKVDAKEVRHYDTIFNGVALSADEAEIEKIEALPGVKSVYVSQEFQRPYLKSSNSIIGSGYAWNTLGYKGEGSVIAVIDSGIDYRHKALRLDEAVQPMYSKEDIEKIIAEKGLKGSYYSNKVPYGYNYYDFNRNLLNSFGVMHGMHVSGIAAANDIDSKTFGVAPNAQILALKVFSDDLEYPTTFTDIWLKALDDAITLKADVINLSLGTAAGFSMENRAYPENEVIEKARKAGIVVSVAAGNDGSITAGCRAFKGKLRYCINSQSGSK